MVKFISYIWCFGRLLVQKHLIYTPPHRKIAFFRGFGLFSPAWKILPNLWLSSIIEDYLYFYSILGALCFAADFLTSAAEPNNKGLF